MRSGPWLLACIALAAACAPNLAIDTSDVDLPQTIHGRCSPSRQGAEDEAIEVCDLLASRGADAWFVHIDQR